VLYTGVTVRNNSSKIKDSANAHLNNDIYKAQDTIHAVRN
jgi:hypothetical protein